jgi:nucleoside-diphosphate-sugar epimerase
VKISEQVRDEVSRDIHVPAFDAAIVTGAHGFLGTHLTQRLAIAGVNVLGVDVAADNRQVAGEKVVCADIRKLGAWTDELNAFVSVARTTVMFHLAGRADVTASRHSPLEGIELNVLGTGNMLEVARLSGVARFLVASSGLVYAPSPELHDEFSLTKAANLYTATKLAAEKLVAGYAAEYGLPADIVRLSNVYGPGAPEGTVVGRICSMIRSRMPIRLKSLRPVRDFIYVTDVVDGMIRMADAASVSGARIVNLSTGLATTVAQLATAACSVAGLNQVICTEGDDDAVADSPLVLANDRLVGLTGWTPPHTLREGLKLTLRSVGVPSI